MFTEWLGSQTNIYSSFFLSSSQNPQPLILTPSCSSVNEWGWGHLAHRFLTRRWPRNKDTVAAVLMLNHSWISRVVTLRSSPVHVSTAWSVCNHTYRRRLAVPGLIVKTAPVSSNFTSPEERKRKTRFLPKTNFSRHNCITIVIELRPWPKITSWEFHLSKANYSRPVFFFLKVFNSD